MGQPVRPVVEQSWQRSLAAGVSIDADTPLLAGSSLDLAKAQSAVQNAVPTIADILGSAAADCDAVLALFDPAGRLVWSMGTATARRRAERIGFVEGSVWDERVAGTNAPGTALAIGEPVQVRGEEHYREAVKAFGCVAAPILDPTTGRVAGALDITGRPKIATAQTMAAVLATARLVGTMLSTPPQLPDRSPSSVPTLSITALGRDRATVTVTGPSGLSGDPIELSPRHSEILVLLADREAGLTGDELAVELYSEDVATSTLRAELNRLKSLLGESVLASRPYRLLAEVNSDWRHASGALDGSEPALSASRYPGPLLPRSSAPGIERLRDRTHFAVRQIVLDSADVGLLTEWTSKPWAHDDYDAWLRLGHLATPGSAPAILAKSQLARLDAEFA